MKTTFISTQSVADATRYQMLRMQAELTKLEKEIVTGKVQDSAVHLGARTGISVSLERDVERLKIIIDSNQLAASRLSATQAGLESLTDLAQNYLSVTTATGPGTNDAIIAAGQARALLTTATSVLNSNLNGENLFAGVNTDVLPINDFFAAGSPARTAMENAFVTYFGFAHTDPLVAGISGADMENFLTTVIEPQFMGTDWNTNWSNATDETITARITLTETASASVSANASGIRRLLMSAATVAVFLEAPLTEEARQSILDHSTGQVGHAVSQISQVQAATGIVENRIVAASERLELQIDIFETKNGDLVGIDPYEASSRISTLLSQIETAYTLTARIRELSLVKHLP
jgi:flagellar hook-associated protein 3 FlgL